MSYRSIHQAIVDKLTTGATKLAQVSYSPKQFESYPAGTVENGSNTNDYNSTRKDMRQYQFAVKVYYLIQDINEMEAGIKAVEECLDEILTLLDRDSLAPTVTMTNPSPGSVVQAEAGDEGVYIIGEVLVETKIYESCS